MPVDDERAAIRRLQQGDIRGLESLMLAWQVPAARVAYLITHDRDLAQDIVQSAFLRVYDRIGQFDASRPFGPWFLRIVANDAARLARGQRRIVRFIDRDETSSDLDPVDADPDPETMLLAAETREEVWRALDRLSPEQRGAVVMHYYLDLPDATTADRLGVPAGTVRSRLSIARTRLRSLLSTPESAADSETSAREAGRR
ncbi:MAG TPA: RNA polymerase sigma factor [Thermomicrobiales bacterium]|nr:RNA polymerase sigma factor [Thermomicrobiales bacterium]